MIPRTVDADHARGRGSDGTTGLVFPHSVDTAFLVPESPVTVGPAAGTTALVALERAAHSRELVEAVYAGDSVATNSTC